MVQSLWNASLAAEVEAGLGELVYRSNIIGTDRRVCNWGAATLPRKQS